MTTDTRSIMLKLVYAGGEKGGSVLAAEAIQHDAPETPVLFITANGREEETTLRVARERLVAWHQARVSYRLATE